MREANRFLGPGSQVVNAKEAFLKVSGEPGMIRKQSNLISDMETVWWFGENTKPATAFL